MGKVVSITGAKEAPRAQQSRMDTLFITQDMANNWKLPPFQRPLRMNDKVRAVAEQIKHDEVIEGVLTLGKLKNDAALYIVDGQHRIEAFRLSLTPEAIADVRVCTFETLGEMADEFVRLNSSLVRMRPDDILRGLESSVPALTAIRQACPFVGYDQIRRGQNSPILGMSALLRCWGASAWETPTGSSAGMSAQGLAQSMTQTSMQNLIGFMATAHAAWGREPENFRLWGSLNLTLCMWMWQRLVIDRERIGAKRYAVLTIPQFKHCLMSVAAEPDYVAWLLGRNVNDRDRSPAYGRLKTIFAARLRTDSPGSKIMLPSPAWASR